jgi:prepilin-type N-terminal cleavage/methylation domain-containing protein
MRGARGFTLVEMMVAIAVFVVVTMGAFVFAKSQMRARKQTQQLLDTEQNARVALDSIRLDLQASGLGVGYALDGVYAGLTFGAFGPFRANDFDHGDGVRFSDDLRVRGATGPVRTIARYDGPLVNGAMEVCAGGGFEVGEDVLLVSESYRDARAVRLTGVGAPIACTEGQCTVNCQQLTFTDASATFETDGNARFASYVGGSAFRGFFEVTYFVEWIGETPGLYRSTIPCATRAACAIADNLLGEGVESLQMRVWEQDPAAGERDVTTEPAYVAAGGVDSTNRLRVDIEVIARSRSPEPEAPPERVCSSIRTTSCFPYGGGTDRHRRRKLLTSVELKNSGHMRFQALR